jgi:CBS domain-containing protein
MRVKDVMNNSPIFISPSTTLKEAASEMRDKDIGFLPIGENDRLIGAVTDRDIAIRGVAGGNGIGDMEVRDIMSERIRYCFEDDPVEKAAEIMSNLQLKRLVVLDSNKRLKGVVSLGDLASKLTDQRICGKVLSDICH